MDTPDLMVALHMRLAVTNSALGMLREQFRAEMYDFELKHYAQIQEDNLEVIRLYAAAEDPRLTYTVTLDKEGRAEVYGPTTGKENCVKWMKENVQWYPTDELFLYQWEGKKQIFIQGVKR